MLIFTPNCVAALVGELPFGDGISLLGDFGRFIKSLSLSGDLSSFIGDLISLSDESVDEFDEDERSDEFGFLRHTSRCRSIEPGNVRGGTRFGNGPG
jgi:hypothetical protein